MSDTDANTIKDHFMFNSWLLFKLFVNIDDETEESDKLQYVRHAGMAVFDDRYPDKCMLLCMRSYTKKGTRVIDKVDRQFWMKGQTNKSKEKVDRKLVHQDQKLSTRLAGRSDYARNPSFHTNKVVPDDKRINGWHSGSMADYHPLEPNVGPYDESLRDRVPLMYRNSQTIAGDNGTQFNTTFFVLDKERVVAEVRDEYEGDVNVSVDVKFYVAEDLSETASSRETIDARLRPLFGGSYAPRGLKDITQHGSLVDFPRGNDPYYALNPPVTKLHRRNDFMTEDSPHHTSVHSKHDYVAQGHGFVIVGIQTTLDSSGGVVKTELILARALDCVNLKMGAGEIDPMKNQSKVGTVAGRVYMTLMGYTARIKNKEYDRFWSSFMVLSEFEKIPKFVCEPEFVDRRVTWTGVNENDLYVSDTIVGRLDSAQRPKFTATTHNPTVFMVSIDPTPKHKIGSVYYEHDDWRVPYYIHNETYDGLGSDNKEITLKIPDLNDLATIVSNQTEIVGISKHNIPESKEIVVSYKTLTEGRTYSSDGEQKKGIVVANYPVTGYTSSDEWAIRAIYSMYFRSQIFDVIETYVPSMAWLPNQTSFVEKGTPLSSWGKMVCKHGVITQNALCLDPKYWKENGWLNSVTFYPKEPKGRPLSDDGTSQKPISLMLTLGENDSIVYTPNPKDSVHIFRQKRKSALSFIQSSSQILNVAQQDVTFKAVKGDFPASDPLVITLLDATETLRAHAHRVFEKGLVDVMVQEFPENAKLLQVMDGGIIPSDVYPIRYRDGDLASWVDNLLETPNGTVIWQMYLAIDRALKWAGLPRTTNKPVLKCNAINLQHVRYARVTRGTRTPDEDVASTIQMVTTKSKTPIVPLFLRVLDSASGERIHENESDIGRETNVLAQFHEMDVVDTYQDPSTMNPLMTMRPPCRVFFEGIDECLFHATNWTNLQPDDDPLVKCIYAPTKLVFPINGRGSTSKSLGVRRAARRPDYAGALDSISDEKWTNLTKRITGFPSYHKKDSTTRGDGVIGIVPQPNRESIRLMMENDYMPNTSEELLLLLRNLREYTTPSDKMELGKVLRTALPIWNPNEESNNPDVNSPPGDVWFLIRAAYESGIVDLSEMISDKVASNSNYLWTAEDALSFADVVEDSGTDVVSKCPPEIFGNPLPGILKRMYRGYPRKPDENPLKQRESNEQPDETSDESSAKRPLITPPRMKSPEPRRATRVDPTSEQPPTHMGTKKVDMSALLHAHFWFGSTV